jgi:hypothetical protein
VRGAPLAKVWRLDPPFAVLRRLASTISAPRRSFSLATTLCSWRSSSDVLALCGS